MEVRLDRGRRGHRRAEAEHASLLRNCKMVYAAAAVLLVGFGVVYRYAVPESIDPWSTRLSLAALCGTLLFATSYVGWLRRHCTQIAAGLLCGLTAWFIVLAALNGFSAPYSLGLVFTVAAIGFALLMTQDGVRPVLFYAGASAFTVLAFVLVIQPPRANGFLTVGAVGGISIIIVLSSKLRTHLVTSLEESERRFRKLSEAAFEAIFITEDDVIVDCNTNALLLLGHGSSERIIGCRLSDFMPQAASVEYRSSEQPDTPYRYESTMLHSDGSFVPVEIRGRSTSEKGHDVRVVAVRDISEQKEYERGLIDARRRVEETLEIRNSILTNVSHEFRTPLAIMLGYAEMLKEGKYEDADELGQLIYESGRKLNDTLNLILELAQIEKSGFALDREPVDVDELVEDVVSSHRTRAASKLLTLDVRGDNSDHTAVADRVRVLKIVDYLVDNAIKFTDEGGIDVWVDSDADWVRIAVQDTGIGIDESFLPQLFEPFKQESSGLTRSHGGLGVGLAIARHMVESMGGVIAVESEKGEGSTFVVSLPRPALRSQSEAPEVSEFGAGVAAGAVEHDGSDQAVWI